MPPLPIEAYAPIVDFVLRADAYTKSGGDTIQAEEYRRQLALLGADVVVHLFRPGRLKLREGSTVHLFNVDQPYEFLECTRSLTGHPVVVSTIHHSALQVRVMRRAEPDARRRLLSYLPESLRSLAVYVVSLMRRTDLSVFRKVAAVLRAVARLPGLGRHVGRQLDDVDGVLLLSKNEGRSLRADYGWTGKNGHLTPNGMPHRAQSDAPKLARILVVGRVEARKRQVEIVQVADALGVPVTFIGPGNPNQGSYFETFQRLVANSRLSEWLGPLPHDEVTQLMASSRVLLNASWVEVQSLVDLEAASLGCRVVTTYDAGSSLEWLGPDFVTELGSADLHGAVARAEEFRCADGASPAPTYGHTWHDTARSLMTIYRSTASGQ